jgi:hypothetical protein
MKGSNWQQKNDSLEALANPTSTTSVDSARARSCGQCLRSGRGMGLGCSRSLLVLISCEANKEEEGEFLKYLLVLRRGAGRMALPEGRRGMEMERSTTGEGRQSLK